MAKDAGPRPQYYHAAVCPRLPSRHRIWKTAEGRDKAGRARLKRAGMRWTVAGANAIIALRCCLLSGRFEDFWERRAANAA